MEIAKSFAVISLSIQLWIYNLIRLLSDTFILCYNLFFLSIPSRKPAEETYYNYIAEKTVPTHMASQ